MLTGTPVTNTLCVFHFNEKEGSKVTRLHNRADLYGLIRFGHFRPWNDWESFNERIVRTLSLDHIAAAI
jgi:hypothetical protein